MFNLEKVAERVVGELGEPGVTEGDGGSGVDVQLLAEGQVLLVVLAVPNVPEAPLENLKDIIEIGLLSSCSFLTSLSARAFQ